MTSYVFITSSNGCDSDHPICSIFEKKENELFDFAYIFESFLCKKRKSK